MFKASKIHRILI